MTQSISVHDWKRLTKGLPALAKPSKYRNVKVKGYDQAGNVITLDSKKEAKRWVELMLLEKKGTIANLQRQVTFHFAAAGRYATYRPSNRKVRYVADFTYTHAGSNAFIVEDVKSKGTKTREYKIKKALVELFHHIEVREV